MEPSKKIKISFLILLGFAILVGILHVSRWEEVPSQRLVVEWEGMKKEISFSDLSLIQVCGVQKTAKGEEREIDAQGCLLKTALEAAVGAPIDAEKVTVFAGDGFSAEVTAEEWEQPEQVYLILREDETIQLLVLGDSDSKRNVKDVERLLIE